MPEGVVKWFNPLKGYGFILPDEGGGDVYFHHSALQRAGLSGLSEGQRVTYELERAQGKTRAVNMRIG